MAAGAGSGAGALLLLLLLLTTLAAADVSSDGAALLAFLTSIPHSPRINWSSSASPCTWHGVSCNPNLTAVTAVRLPAADLAGPVPANTLCFKEELFELSRSCIACFRFSHRRKISVCASHIRWLRDIGRWGLAFLLLYQLPENKDCIVGSRS